MDQATFSSLDELYARWGKPPSPLDAETIAWLCDGLTLERNSCPDLGLRRRQGWKKAQHVLEDVATVLSSASPRASSPDTDSPPLEPFAPLLDLSPVDPAPVAAAYKSPDRSPPSLGIREKYFAYLDLLTGATTKASSHDDYRTADEGQDFSSPSSATDSDNEASTCSATTTPSPMATTTKPTSRATTPTPHVAVPPSSPVSNPFADPEDDEHEPPAAAAPALHPMLLSRLNATWSNLLALDLASRTVEHRVARDLGALRRQREVALDGLLGDMMSCGPEWGVEEGRYGATMRALAARVDYGGDDGEGMAVMGEWMSEGKQREVDAALADMDAEWEELARLRRRVERELVETGLLEYED